MVWDGGGRWFLGLATKKGMLNMLRKIMGDERRKFADIPDEAPILKNLMQARTPQANDASRVLKQIGP